MILTFFTSKHVFHLIGNLISVIGIVFVGYGFYQYYYQINFINFNIVVWLVVAGFALIYSLANLMLAFAWWNLLGQFGASTTRRWALKTYGVSQLAKYVPGNIFHLAGRQAMGMGAGVSAWPLAKSSVWELVLISATGVLFGLLAIPLLVAALPVSLGVGVFVLAVGIAAVILWRYVGPPVARTFGWYVCFLAVSGALFVGVMELVSAHSVEAGLPWIPLCGAYVLAWLAGLVTPGAPAGVGVRELVLLFLLKGIVAEADLLLAVVLGRVVTVMGDFSFFVFSSLMEMEV